MELRDALNSKSAPYYRRLGIESETRNRLLWLTFPWFSQSLQIRIFTSCSSVCVRLVTFEPMDRFLWILVWTSCY